MPEPVLLVHGGAKSYEAVQKLGSGKMFMDAVKLASTTGYQVLKREGRAVDAVEAAVSVLEDSEYFNAGRGSNLTTDWAVEMDAAIMDGSDLSLGGVTCITNIKHPITLARVVMEKSNAILLTGEGARKFAEEHLEKSAFAPLEYFVTPHAKARLEDHLNEKQKSNISETALTNVQLTEQKDTVGAVALDCHGNVAYANSTGGVVGRVSGRIGDSPIVGCGGYADNAVGAIATTGTGELICKVSLAKHIAMLLEQGKRAQEASEEAVTYLKEKLGGQVGVITISPEGDTGVYFNSTGMAWALAKDKTLSWGMLHAEKNSQAIL